MNGVRPLALAVALIAGAMLLLEVMLTRIFSVLFYYHFSFFAVSLVMTGIALGGLLISRWDAAGTAETTIFGRLAWLAVAFSVLVLIALGGAWVGGSTPPVGIAAVAAEAIAFLPALTAGGAFLAGAFAAREAWISRLYAADLAAAAIACVGAIALMRLLEGFSMLLAPAAVAAAAALPLARRGSGARITSVLLLSGCLVLGIASVSEAGPERAEANDERILFEAWNEHSRVLVLPGPTDDRRYIVIDRSAGTFLPEIGSEGQDAPPIDLNWVSSTRAFAYLLPRRPPRRVAIIGVGGGEDLLAPLAAGAGRVDGFELNRILVDLLESGAGGFNAIARRPEVELVHAEGRVALSRTPGRYDVIQASLVDTWAATASGGFVLSENGLYTVEGWQTLLRALTPRGVLSMTRWLLETEPAETQRLVSLAVAALDRAGIADPGRHLILISHDRHADSSGVSQATILVSPEAFTQTEIAILAEAARERSAMLLRAPGLEANDPVLRGIIDPRTRASTIRTGPYDLSPPTDARPYFFLQLKPSSALRSAGGSAGWVTEITFAGVRVLLLLLGLSTLFAAAVAAIALLTLPGAAGGPAEKRIYRWMTPYFAGIGLGYMLIQLGLHQRLILILGHPTLVLSVVLFWMLLGTGAGAWSSGFLATGRVRTAWVVIVLALAGLLVAYPAFGGLEELPPAMRASVAGGILFATGFFLGLAFPIGVRIVARSGERSVQKMWAVNGAASIAGASVAAIVGVLWGSQAVIGLGLLAYAVGLPCGLKALAISMPVSPRA